MSAKTVRCRKGSKVWYIRGTIEGRRFERSTGTTSRRQAEQLKKTIVAEVAVEFQNAEKQEKIHTNADWQDIPFSTAVLAYLDQGGSNRFLEKLLNHFENTKLGTIDQLKMNAAQNSIYPDAAASTVRRQLFVPVNAIINACKTKKLTAPKGEGIRTEFLTPEQAERMINIAASNKNPYMSAMIIFLIGQGVRTGDLFSLRGRDLNLISRYATIRDPKNGEERTITLIPRVVAAMSLLPNVQDEDLVFKRWDMQNYKPKSGRGGQIRNPFAAIVERAGLDPKKITPHVLRHTWATWYYTTTKDIIGLKNEGGWKSNAYERYVKIAPLGMKDQILTHNWQFGGGKLGEGSIIKLVSTK
jgi:integrase